MRARLFQAVLGLLRAVVSPDRPLVMVVDDLQWAGAVPIGFVDAVLVDEDLPGLLLVGAYRDAEVDAAHPLSAMLARWERLGVAPAAAAAGQPAADRARAPARRDAAAGARPRPPTWPRRSAARTGGNPYDTVELVNALRRDGALTADDRLELGRGHVRRFVGQGDVVDLLTARIDALPAEAAALLEVMACLGGEVELDLLAAAAGLDAAAAARGAGAGAGGRPARDGPRRRRRAVRFRHDRVQQAAYARLDPGARAALHLHLARRLAADAASRDGSPPSSTCTACRR